MTPSVFMFLAPALLACFLTLLHGFLWYSKGRCITGFSFQCPSFLSEALHLLACSVCALLMLISSCRCCSLNHIGCGCCPFAFSLSPVSLSCSSEDVSNLFLRFSYNCLYLLLCFQFWTVDFFALVYFLCSVLTFLSCTSSLAKTVVVADICCLEYL